MTPFAVDPHADRAEDGVHSFKPRFITSEDRSELLEELTDETEVDDAALQTQGSIPDLPRGPRQLHTNKQSGSP